MNDLRTRVGIGGWNYEPWRETFYPGNVPRSRELDHASRQLTAIEVNGTYYSTFKPATFAKWRAQVPDGFVFTLKAHMAATNRKVLAESGPAIERFVASGISQLGDALGPIVWQFMPTRRFDPDDLGAFLAMLPREADGIRLRHVLDVRHESFDTPAYFELARRHGCATVHTDAPKYPNLVDADNSLAYVRLLRTQGDCATGYPEPELAKWAQGARDWVARGPEKEAFIFFINGAKERNPAAAMKLIRLLG